MKHIYDLIGLIVYVIVGIICLYIAGLDFRAYIGFGIIFGFIMGVLNELHRDLSRLIDIINKKG